MSHTLLGKQLYDYSGKESSYNSFEFFRPDNEEAMKIRKYEPSASEGLAADCVWLI